MLNAIKCGALAAALFAIPLAPAHAAMTSEQCSALLAKYDTNGDGSIGKSEDSKKFEEAMTKTSLKTKQADTVSQEEFMSACEKGTFDGM